MRLNARRRGRMTGHLCEPRPQPRLEACFEAIDEFLAARPGGGRESRDFAPERPPQYERAESGAWDRAVEKMAASREARARRPRRHDSVPGGLGQMAGILPPWVAEDGPEEALGSA